MFFVDGLQEQDHVIILSAESVTNHILFIAPNQLTTDKQPFICIIVWCGLEQYHLHLQRKTEYLPLSQLLHSYPVWSKSDTQDRCHYCWSTHYFTLWKLQSVQPGISYKSFLIIWHFYNTFNSLISHCFFQKFIPRSCQCYTFEITPCISHHIAPIVQINLLDALIMPPISSLFSLTQSWCILSTSVVIVFLTKCYDCVISYYCKIIINYFIKSNY